MRDVLRTLTATWLCIFTLPSGAQAEDVDQERTFNGWTTAQPQREQTAYYQSQGTIGDRLPPVSSLSDRSLPAQPSFGQIAPVLPPGGGSAGTASGSRSDLPSLPPSFSGGGPNALGRSGSVADDGPSRLPADYGSRQATEQFPQRLPGNGLPSNQSSQGQPFPSSAGNASNSPPPNQKYSSLVGSETVQYNSNVMPPQQVMPPRNVPSRNVPGQTIGYEQPAGSGGSAGNRLRGIDDRPTRIPNGRMDPNTITTGPPFVTPAPRSRYPTSPYNRAFFQTVAFQRTEAEAARANGGMQLAATQVSPQISRQAAPGIYPTAYQQCQPQLTLPAGPPPNLVPGTITPDLAPTVYSANNAGLRPLISLGQENYNVQLGRGIIGQPTVYVPRQPVRNFLRYLFP